MCVVRWHCAAVLKQIKFLSTDSLWKEIRGGRTELAAVEVGRFGVFWNRLDSTLESYVLLEQPSKQKDPHRGKGKVVPLPKGQNSMDSQHTVTGAVLDSYRT